MAITVEARTEIISLVVGMFGAAPGASVLSDLVAAYEAGSSISQIAASLANTNEFKGIYPTFLTNGEYATKVVDNLLPEASAAAKAEAVAVLTAELNGGMTRTTAMVEAIKFVSATATDNASFGTSAAAFDNKVAVAVYYSVDKQLSGSTLTALQEVVKNVTSSAATVTTAKAKADGDSTVGETFSLTIGVDTFTGKSGDDTFVGNVNTTPAATLSALDNIDGGAGEDTLTVSDPSNTAYTFPTSATIKNIETIKIVHAADAATDDVVVDVSNVTGVKTLSVVNSGTEAQLTVTTKGNVTSATLQGGDVDTDAAAAAVAITDSATTDTLATVTLSGIKDSNATTADVATVTSSALTTLNVASSSVGVTVTAAAGTRALTLGLDGVTGGVITDAQATTVNVKGSGSTSSGVTLTAGSATSVTIDAAAKVTLADVNIGAATKLTATGASAVAVSALSTVTKLTAIDGSAADGGLTIGAAIGTGVTFTGGKGADSVIVGATTKAITTAAGDDTVTVAGVSALGSGGSIDAGEGTDTLKFSTYANAVTASAGTTFEGSVSGFERLELSGANAAAAAAVNLANLDDINYVTMSATNTETTTISGMTSGGTIVFKADQTAGKDATVAITNANTNTTDVLNVVLSKSTALAAVELIAADVETINITSSETATTKLGTVTHALELNATAAKTLNISGNAGVTFGTLTGATALTSIDASGVTTGLVSFTTDALTTAATIKGGAGANTITASAATKVVTYTGSDKVDTIVIANALANVINTGGGDDNVTIGTGNVTVDLGAGNDTLVVGSASTQTQNITLGAGTDTVDINAKQASAGAYLSLKDFAVGDKIDVAGVINGAIAGATLGAKITLGAAATFANYIDAAAAGAGNVASIDGWFQLGGNTYLVVDNSAAATFQDGSDIVVEIVGTVDLTATTQVAGVYTLV